jgi:3-hydroxybutyryl-CoA dehydrogenase
MKTGKIERVLVVGAGQMVHQIAMLCALGGYTNILQDFNQAALQNAETSLRKRMDEWLSKKKLTVVEKDAAFARLSYSNDLEDAAKNADLVIEAIIEKLDAKRELFRELDRITPEHTILASNSSTIVNSLLAEVTNRPEKVCNMHFFFPPLVMDIVEVVMSDKTSEETAETAMDVCKQINREGILLRKEISGFVANRILGAINREAISLYEKGFADFKDIDHIVKKSLGHPLGPFELIDLSGADVVYYVMQQQYAETGKEEDKPAACIIEKVKAGELGRKTGQGFYTYKKEELVRR